MTCSIQTNGTVSSIKSIIVLYKEGNLIPTALMPPSSKHYGKIKVTPAQARAVVHGEFPKPETPWEKMCRLKKPATKFFDGEYAGPEFGRLTL